LFFTVDLSKTLTAIEDHDMFTGFLFSQFSLCLFSLALSHQAWDNYARQPGKLVFFVSGTRNVTETFLQRIARGEQAAVQECLARYAGLVWSLAKRFLGNASEAEDAVQDIFIELWKKADRFNPLLSSESTYITMVTRRRLIDRRRQIVRRPELVSLPENIASSQQPGTKQVDMVDEASKAAAALQELKPEQQRVLKMAVYQGLTHEEISQHTGLPLGTVKTHARRGLIKLQEVLSFNSPSYLAGM
jgi:RNA polymerase sigma factor (sigma-70 family)